LNLRETRFKVGVVSDNNTQNMSLSIGIVGQPNVGKSTLFNAMLKSKKAEVGPFAFTTKDPNIGIIKVPDKRLSKLSNILNLPKIIPATIKFVDIAGLIKNAHQGEGLGNQFLAHIREVDAILLLFRLFENKKVAHTEEKINPKKDTEIIETELILSDLRTIQKRIEETKTEVKSEEKKARIALAALEKINKALNRNELAHKVKLEKEEKPYIKELNLLTSKPIIYVANISEKDLPKPKISDLPEMPSKIIKDVVYICASLESELSDLSKKEQQEYLAEYNMKESGLNQLIRIAYHALGLITFYTTTKEQIQAWPIEKNNTILKAAAKIHTDFAKKFIRAEVVSYLNIVKAGTLIKAAKMGLIKAKGKDYRLRDGDLIYIRHN